MGKVEQNLIEKAKAINDFMLKNPRALRSAIAQGSGVNMWSCKKLEALGMIKLPPPLSNSIAGKIGRAKQKKSFRLYGSPTTGKRIPPTFLPGIDYR
ncbi:hypothetical protein UFOVP26_20 [uncultured Caudovirales phage]|uniref:Uncharacterized protein n=1 Tax=uncultured Caudovirales phage TaxID=2100421 RepID=A0A6J5KRR1_9CAUD|nr:hypothetical protein UFOVP26_20 [uncultured Caudovirales phage]CAB4123885.1 hypothetical protein UFOVP44_77 [uncultured Caudovirales phage]CAB5219344.1 hypothetical protein UFOVP220_68 [uncultured Caudovirales phage]